MSALKPVPPAAPDVAETVHEYILRSLRDAIVSGEFAPGQKLIESDLQVRLGVSRPSLREGLRQLASERLIRMTPNKGPSVAEITWEEAEQIYEMRELLEGQAAALFATRAQDVEVMRLKKSLEAFERASKAPSGFKDLLDSAKSFYEVISQGCGNQMMAEILTGLFARINLLRSRSMSMPERSAESAREMRQLYVAIAARDAKASKAASVYHVRQARRAAQLAFEAHAARAARKQPAA
jgi:DNA-binding GntR family transcriptional regulator